jgi:hypothetical protein
VIKNIQTLPVLKNWKGLFLFILFLMQLFINIKRLPLSRKNYSSSEICPDSTGSSFSTVTKQAFLFRSINKSTKMKTLTTTIFILFFGILATFSQHTISGKIIDEQNQPLPFANVILYKIGEEANPKGTVSDDQGNYTLENVVSGKYKIEISMLGFETHKIKEFELSSNKTFNITLKEESQTLNEVVI